MPRSTISGVEDYTRSGDRVTFECTIEQAQRTTLQEQEGEHRPDGGRTVPVSIQFYNPSAFRFELHANPETGDRESLVDLDETAIRTAVDLDVFETDDGIVIDSGDLRVTVGRDPWSFAVEDEAGRTVFEEQREDRNAKAERRTDPLGFTEEVVNNWPLSVTETGTTFKLAPDEHCYGLGEQFTEFDKRGRTINVWNTQPNGSETEAAYKNIPFLLSTRGYGLLVETTERVEFDLGDTSTVSGRVSVDDDSLEFVFFHGPSFKEIIEQYTALTGRPHRPPKWSFGIWMSKYGYRTRDELESVTARLREEELPCDVVHLDPTWLREDAICDMEWDTAAFPDPEGMIETLHDRGFHLCLWENPYVPVGCEAFETAREEGYFVNDRTGEPYLLDRLSISTYRAGIVDFTDPEATEWWKQKHRELTEMGVDVFKTDFGEYLPRDAVLANGRSGRSMRNIYPHLYQRAVHEAMREVNGIEDTLLWARSGWIGSQQFPVHWPGDPYTSFESMGAVLRGGLSLALCGFAFWSHDIGEFKGEPDTELYIRDTQFGLLNSHARYHGTTPREPWHYGEDAMDVYRKFAALRYSLVPYLYSYAERATRTGLPVMRPLVLEYQDDGAVYDLGTQFLLGEELLVAPVFNDEDRARVYLPEGDDWIGYWSGDRYGGGQTLHLEEIPLDETPLFVRVGSILPRREPGQTVQAGTPETVELETRLAATGATTATFEFYDEDRDRLVTLEASIDGDRETLGFAVEAPDLTGVFEAEVVAIDSPPEEVRLNDEALRPVEEDPDPGEWAYHPDDALLVANFD